MSYGNDFLVEKLNDLSDVDEKESCITSSLDCEFDDGVVDYIGVDVDARMILDVSDVGITMEDIIDKNLTEEKLEELRDKAYREMDCYVSDLCGSFRSSFLERFGIELG